MPQVSGNLKTNKLTLQGKGPLSTENLVMEVLKNEFTMSMGSNILITVGPDGVSDINEASSYTNAVLTIGRDTDIDADASFTANSNLVARSDVRIQNELLVGSNIVLNAQISDEMKAALTSICDSGAWQPSYGQVNDLLPYGSNIFTPAASVHIWKNGDSWEYNAGKLNTSSTSPNPDADTIYFWGSMTKPITALLYARLKTIGVIPAGHAVKVSDVFPTMKDITYAVPSFSSTSNASTVCVDPNDGSRWVNLTTTTRELYLEDVLSESAGFANLDSSSLFPVSASTSDPIVAYNIAASNVYGSATAGVYNALSGDPINTVELEPTTHFTNYIAKFSNGGVFEGKPCIMYNEHGVFNYHSSANIGTATLLQFYRNKYPAASNMSYFDVLKKELLDPVDSDLFYYFNSADDPRFAKLAAAWKPAPDNSGYVINRFVDVSESVYPTIGFLYRLATYSPTAFFKPKNYSGNFGLFGTKADFSKVVRLQASHGLTTSGVRLIHAKEIANLLIPRVTINEFRSAVTIYEQYKTLIGTYGLGGNSSGPSYASAYTTEPDFQLMFSDDVIGILSSADVGTITYYDSPKNQFGSTGAAGTLYLTCAETRTVAIVTTHVPQDTMSWYKVFKPILNVLYNDYCQPSALTPAHVVPMRTTRFLDGTVGTRQTVLCAGTTLNNDRYLPPSNSIWENNGVSNMQVFNAVPGPPDASGNPISANAPTYSGVCDEEYVYYPWEIGSDAPNGLGPFWGIFSGPFASFQNSACILVKQSRTTGVIVLSKPLASITGRATTNTMTLNGLDISRGPFGIYNGYLYIPIMGNNPCVIKVRCSDFSLVWLKYIPDNVITTFPDHPELNNWSCWLRTLIVIPPNEHRSNALVICGTNAGIPYSTISYDALLKLSEYHNANGNCYAFEDTGSDAVLNWEFRTGPDPLQTGSLLSSNSFSINSDGSLKHDLKMYYPLMDGYVFHEGNSTTGIEHTNGTFNLLTGNQVSGPGVTPEQVGILTGTQWEFGKFTFTNEVFHSSNTYQCVVQNGPRLGSNVWVAGSNLYDSTNVNGYQPVVKTVYTSQIGVKVLDKYEAYELSQYGGGLYGNYCYDVDRDCIIFGTGNDNHTTYEHEYETFRRLNPSSSNPLVYGELQYLNHNEMLQVIPQPVTESVCSNIRALQHKYWTDRNTIRDTVDFGNRYRRFLSNHFIGLNCSNGALMFAAKTGIVDCVDHSITLVFNSAKSGVFHADGNNQDAIQGCIIANFDNTNNTYGVTGKYLIGATKSRVFLYDYNKLFDQLEGVPGDSSVDFKQGLSKNTCSSNALVWEETIGPVNFGLTFGGMAFDGKTLVRRQEGARITLNQTVYEPGLNPNPNAVLSDPTYIILGKTKLPSVYGYDVAKLIATRPTSIDGRDIYKWAVTGDMLGSTDFGSTFIYGNVCMFGDKAGTMRFINVNTGTIISTINIPEGFPVAPLIADGIMYGYGGNNKWSSTVVDPSYEKKLGSRLLMWTPFGR